MGATPFVGDEFGDHRFECRPVEFLDLSEALSGAAVDEDESTGQREHGQLRGSTCRRLPDVVDSPLGHADDPLQLEVPFRCVLRPATLGDRPVAGPRARCFEVECRIEREDR